MQSEFKPAIRVFLADDHAVVRQGLKTMLQQDGYEVVGEASDGRAAIKMCCSLQPDIAILDISMPLLNGIDAVRGILRECPKTSVIVFTVHADEDYILASLRAGVKGYVLKSSPGSSVGEAIEAACRHETYLSPGVSRTLVQAYLANVVAPADPLSTREREVLQLIAEGKNMKEIGGVLGISARTAETHRTRLMQKLGIKDVAGLVRYAIRHGLMSIETGPASTKEQRLANVPKCSSNQSNKIAVLRVSSGAA